MCRRSNHFAPCFCKASIKCVGGDSEAVASNGTDDLTESVHVVGEQRRREQMEVYAVCGVVART